MDTITSQNYLAERNKQLRARVRALRNGVGLLTITLVAVCCLFCWQLWSAHRTHAVQAEAYKAHAASLESSRDLWEAAALRYKADAEEAVKATELVGAEYVGSFMATAYCCEKYEHICGEGHGVTRSGLPVQAGVTVAADPDVLPMGSVIYIEGVGIRIVQDTGGAIKGNKIDVAVDTHANALKWSGYGEHAVYILSINNNEEV